MPGGKQMTTDRSEFVATGCTDTEDQDELPVATVTSDKSWTL